MRSRSGMKATGPITVIRAGTRGKHASLFESMGICALKFLGTGDVGGMTRDEIFDHVAIVFPDNNDASLTQYTRQLYFFLYTLGSGDTIVTPDMISRDVLIGQITGRYEFRARGIVDRDFKHVRPVRWQDRLPWDALSEPTRRSLSGLATVFQPGPSAQAELTADISHHDG
jgi:restriction system protein